MPVRTKPLIFLADLIHNQYAYNYTVPLNVGYVAASLKQKFGNDIELRIFKFPDELIAALIDKPDILAVSNYDWNVNINKAVISMAKARNPGTFIVMGGPNIRNRREGTQLFLETHPYVDAYVLYEGEVAFTNLIEHYIGHEGTLHNSLINENKELPQIAYLSADDKRLIMGGLLPATSMKEIPHPSAWLNGYMDEYLNCKYFPLSPIIETTRGCPYACTYCTAWGSEATGVKTIRQFPLEIVYEELEYIFKRAEQEFYLILGDANIGILKRDVEICERIRQLSEKYGKVTQVGMDTSKNSLDRNVLVYKALGDLSIPTFAQQTFNEDISVNIGRKNVSFERTVGLIEEVHSSGATISTDILIGLPGEDKKGHVNSIKMAFDAGFDRFQIGDIRLLLGTRMEEDDQRELYGIKTKVRIIPNAFGEYSTEKVIDYEVCIRETKDLSEDEFLQLRLFHGNVFLMLNLEFGRPLLDLAQNNGMHPVDLIAAVSEFPPQNEYPLLYQHYSQYMSQAGSEWFPTQEDADEYYFQEKVWDNLKKEGFPKLNYEAASSLIVSCDLSDEFLKWIAVNLKKNLPHLDSRLVEQVVSFTDKRFLRLPLKESQDEFEFSNDAIKSLKRYFSKDALLADGDSKKLVQFSMDKKEIESIENMMSSHKGARSERHAVQLVLQFHNKAFLRKVSVVESGVFV